MPLVAVPKKPMKYAGMIGVFVALSACASSVRTVTTSTPSLPPPTTTTAYPYETSPYVEVLDFRRLAEDICAYVEQPFSSFDEVAESLLDVGMPNGQVREIMVNSVYAYCPPHLESMLDWFEALPPGSLPVD